MPHRTPLGVLRGEVKKDRSSDSFVDGVAGDVEAAEATPKTATKRRLGTCFRTPFPVHSIVLGFWTG